MQFRGTQQFSTKSLRLIPPSLAVSDTYRLNPQYFVRLTDPDPGDDVTSCTLVVSLMQKHTRLRRTQEGRADTEAAIAVDVYKV